MALHNIEIADKFNKLANLLEIQGENPFRIRAYRNAARVIRGLSKNVSELIAQGKDLTELPGIGKDLAEKITLLAETGKFPLLSQVEMKLPSVLNDLMRIEGLGAKRIQLIYRKFKIKNVQDLKKIIENGKLRKVKGFGEKIEQKILQGITHINQTSPRLILADVNSIVESLLAYLKQISPDQLACAGSYRRHKETIADLDIVVAAKNTKKVIDHFVKYDEIANILAKGTTRSTVRLRSGIQVDLRVVPKESYGAALLYFTGSKEHNIALRRIALKKKLKVNEYGVFKGRKQLAGKTENDIYQLLGMSYVEPELREERGEIAKAYKDDLPQLISLKDIRGDLHCHTTATDGEASIEEMANAAIALGYNYIAITDHSKHLAMVHGHDEKSLLKQIKLIDKLNEKFNKIVILKSIELDILESGKLDLANDVLKELDFTVCSIHSKFNLSPKTQTERIIRAMDNPYFNIFGHPTGRIINKREAYPIYLEEVLQAAKERNCIIELNAQPNRLDLDDNACKLAKEIGVKIAISTDAHSVEQLKYMKYGVYQARRGWLEKQNVINTYSLKELMKLMKRN